MKKTIAIVGCGAQKQDGTHPAHALYTGSLFRSNLSAARAIADEVFILSAKYGLISADSLVDSYECRLGDEGSVTVEEIEEGIAALGLDETEAYVLAGGDYFEALWLAASNLQWWDVHYVHEGALGMLDMRKGCRIARDDSGEMAALAARLEAEIEILEKGKVVA